MPRSLYAPALETSEGSRFNPDYVISCQPFCAAPVASFISLPSSSLPRTSTKIGLHFCSPLMSLSVDITSAGIADIVIGLFSILIWLLPLFLLSVVNGCVLQKEFRLSNAMVLPSCIAYTIYINLEGDFQWGMFLMNIGAFCVGVFSGVYPVILCLKHSAHENSRSSEFSQTISRSVSVCINAKHAPEHRDFSDFFCALSRAFSSMFFTSCSNQLPTYQTSSLGEGAQNAREPEKLSAKWVCAS